MFRSFQSSFSVSYLKLSLSGSGHRQRRSSPSTQFRHCPCCHSSGLRPPLLRNSVGRLLAGGKPDSVPFAPLAPLPAGLHTARPGMGLVVLSASCTGDAGVCHSAGDACSSASLHQCVDHGCPAHSSWLPELFPPEARDAWRQLQPRSSHQLDDMASKVSDSGGQGIRDLRPPGRNLNTLIMQVLTAADLICWVPCNYDFCTAVSHSTLLANHNKEPLPFT